MKKPIDKEYLTNTLKSFDAEVSETKYLHNNDPSVHTHDNKTILDKISKSDKGTLLFDGKEVGNTESSSGSTEYDILSTSSEVKENAVAGKLVDALVIKEVFQSVSDGKELLASAITDKGVDTDANDSFASMAEKIRSISNAPSLKISWANATDTEIAAALNAHYAGIIDISNYWNVGDVRTIHLSAMGSWKVGTNENGETHKAQDIEVVIIGFNVDNLAEPINGVTKAAITVQLKNTLPNTGMIDYNFNEYYENHSTYTASWLNCKRRDWANTIFKNSLPDSLSPLLKQVSKTAYGFKHTYSTSSNTWNSTYINKQFSQDYCFLLSPREVGVTDERKSILEFNGYKEGDIEWDYLFDGETYEYYYDENNRKKNTIWWTRFPTYSSGPAWSSIHTGKMGSGFERSNYGISPAFCL